MNTKSKVKKKYRVNITAAYGADLMTSGVTGIPNLLLKYYKKMCISDEEMMLLIQLLRLRMEEKNYYPTIEQLGQYLPGTAENILQRLKSLQERNLLGISHYYHESNTELQIGYDFEPLFEMLSDFWAFDRVKEIEKAKMILEQDTEVNQDFSSLYKLFEKEFGRSLSPIEVEKIEQWSKQIGATLVGEALSRAVLMGVRNLKYVDSIILEWEKNNLRTLDEIHEYDRRFKERQLQSARYRSAKVSSIEEDKREKNKKEENRKKALIKELYMS